MLKPSTKALYMREVSASDPKLTVIQQAERDLQIAQDRYFNTLAIEAMKTGIKHTWKLLEPHLANGPTMRKSKVFSLVSVSMVHAFKQGYNQCLGEMMNDTTNHQCQPSGRTNSRKRRKTCCCS